MKANRTVSATIPPSPEITSGPKFSQTFFPVHLFARMNYPRGFPAEFGTASTSSKEPGPPYGKSECRPEPRGDCSPGLLPILCPELTWILRETLQPGEGGGVRPHSPGLSSSSRVLLSQSQAPGASYVPSVKWAYLAGYMASRLLSLAPCLG